MKIFTIVLCLFVLCFAGCKVIDWLGTTPTTSTGQPAGPAPIDTIVDTSAPYVSLLPYGGLIVAVLGLAREYLKRRVTNGNLVATVQLVQEARKNPIVVKALQDAAKVVFTEAEKPVFDVAIAQVKKDNNIVSVS
jgi:hypothetical protein